MATYGLSLNGVEQIDAAPVERNAAMDVAVIADGQVAEMREGPAVSPDPAPEVAPLSAPSMLT